METLTYIPAKQTIQAEMAYKRMQEAVERLKQEMGTKYLLAKENAIQRADARAKTLVNVGGNTAWLSTELHNEANNE